MDTGTSQFEPFFCMLANGSIYKELHVDLKRQLVNWPQVVCFWREIVNQHPPILTIHGPLFATTINLPGKGFYHMAWDIIKAQSLIANYRLTSTTWSVKILKESARISKDTCKTVPGPIIVVEYPVINTKMIVIDGNHRVLAAAEKNQDSKVTGFSLNMPLMLESLANSTFRLYFEIH